MKKSFNILKNNNEEQKNNRNKILHEEFIMKMTIT